jgi:hypothetical protein
VPDYLCYATFQVVGDDLVPEDWSAYFGVDSTFSVQRGCRMFPHKGEDSLLGDTQKRLRHLSAMLPAWILIFADDCHIRRHD